MKCPRCQHENGSNAKFCQECAAPLSRTCSKCGNELPPTAKFCPECAHPAGHAVVIDQGRFNSPETYTPKHLAERILTSKAALEGERKQVTVLFADLKGSMELLADQDPEEARKLLDPVLEHMIEAVHRYEGTVNQVMGDGIMALVGAPLAHEDHAVRACYAALKMQESIGRYADELRRSRGVDVQIRIGLNSGEVVVRSVGSDLRMDYTAVGQTTHLAARMEQLARPGTVLLTPATLALAGDFIQVRSLGPTPVKGITEPIDVYELTGALAVRSRFQAHAARGLTKFVGRTTETAQLVDAIDLAKSGRGQVVGVVGEPGVGKSRLVWELAHSHRVEGCLVVEAASVSYGRATTYLPVIELLRDYFQIESRDDTRKIREKVTGKVFSLDRALEPALPAMLALLDVPVEDEPWKTLDPSQRRQRTLEAVKRLLLRESQVQPLVVVFEDLHWIDAETQAILETLIESVPTARVLLLVNYRPEYRHAWGSKTYYRQLRLDALPAASADELLDSLLGSDLTLTSLKRVLIQRTEGNPFFLEESVRMLVESGVLAGPRGGYRLTRALETLQIPATAQAILASRIDRLDPADKRLLQAAAVIGKDVPLVLLKAIVDVDGDALGRGLDRLRGAEFLYETRLFPDIEYTFRHALTHEVAYASLLGERRRGLHGRIVETIERLYPDRLIEHVERLAHHAVRGEVWEKAVTYYRRAGAKAASRSAYREAVTCFEQALIALGRLPQTRETIEQNIDLRCELRIVYFPLGDHKRAFEHLSAAEPLASSLNDQPRLARVLGLQSTNFVASAENVRALEVGERALSIATAHGDAALEDEARLRLAVVHHMLGNYSKAIDLGRKVVASLAIDPLRENVPELLSVVSRWWLGWSLAERGDFAEAITLAEEASRLAEGPPSNNQALACVGLGLVRVHQGDLQRANSPLERGVQVCHALQIRLWLPGATSYLGLAYALSGRTAEGLPLLEQAVEQAESIPSWQSAVTINLGQGYLLSGRLPDAMRVAENAIELTRERKGRGFEGRALWLLGEIAVHPDSREVEQAETHYREATGLATKLGMRPLVAHCHLGLGKLYRRTGPQQKAQEHLATAMTMYRELDMPYWLKKAEAEMRELA